mmetsp:Transcript_52679/g.58900  ORF Transcript_52679/g.58900 Transcript_52679/m.58900 type:complete len:205 (+) Transcript_52679:931-1545(+)
MKRVGSTTFPFFLQVSVQDGSTIGIPKSAHCRAFRVRELASSFLLAGVTQTVVLFLSIVSFILNLTPFKGFLQSDSIRVVSSIERLDVTILITLSWIASVKICWYNSSASTVADLESLLVSASDDTCCCTRLRFVLVGPSFDEDVVVSRILFEAETFPFAVLLLDLVALLFVETLVLSELGVLATSSSRLVCVVDLDLRVLGER